jgi:hypothetical protein
MRKWCVAILMAGGLTLGVSAPAFADNPHSGTTGQPGESCQNYSPTTRPGLSYQSGGSPFNEGQGVNSINGGTGGAHYSDSSQYDVACFQANAHSS